MTTVFQYMTEIERPNDWVYLYDTSAFQVSDAIPMLVFHNQAKQIQCLEFRVKIEKGCTQPYKRDHSALGQKMSKNFIPFLLLN